MRSNPLTTCKVFALVFVFCALAAAPASAQTGGASATRQKPQRPTVLFPNERPPAPVALIVELSSSQGSARRSDPHREKAAPP